MLYRKYRPQQFSELVGQEHVVQTLEGALTTGRVGHAYLFTGSRGTGKTTMARLFAKALNCENRGKSGEPCNTCPSCLAVNNGTSLDLIEIDAASQTGVDNIRELTDSAMVAAAGGKYKVFLIDEVHMLSKSAFNALLKTLEEPPAHVVFILATTEPHKILATVLSRVQRFDFKRVSGSDIVKKLKKIAEKENISIVDNALVMIAKASDGSLRDAEVMLTKVQSSYPNTLISEGMLAGSLGLIPQIYLREFLKHLLSGDKKNALDIIHLTYDSGLDLENFAKEFIAYTRSALLARVNPTLSALIEGPEAHQQLVAMNADNDKLIKIMNLFTTARSQIKFSPIPQLPLELAVMQL